MVRSLFLGVVLAALAAAGSVQFAGAVAGGGEPSPPSTVPGGPPIGPVATTVPPPTTTTIAPDAPLRGLRLEVVGRLLDQPLLVLSPPGDDRLFVIEKPGRIKVIEDGVILETPFLDLTDIVNADGAELGLLGLAFHPRYEWNGRFFVHYTDLRSDSRLVEYRATNFDPNRADPGSGRELLFLDQPQSFHQGGMLQFGPEGYLYVSLGDGGGIGDQYGHGQRPDTLFGTIVRIDVDNGDPYAIPPDNPFVGTGEGAPEVWSYGLRNPWRVAIDAETGLMYVADVGQFEWEEISVVSLADDAGANFGWSVVEGFVCYEKEICERDGFVAPIVVYNHRRAGGCAVIGGFVYRGVAIPELNGHYFYGDWCGQFVRSFRYADGAATEVSDWTDDIGKVGPITSFGQDAAGELYVTTGNGGVYRIVPDR